MMHSTAGEASRPDERTAHCGEEWCHRACGGPFVLGLIDINGGDRSGLTPLIMAAEHNHPQVVRILLDNGADPSIGEHGSSFTALHVSAEFGHPAVVEMLTKAVGAEDLEAETSEGSTPLLLAADEGHSGVI